MMCREGNFRGLRLGDYLDLPEIVMGYERGGGNAIGGLNKETQSFNSTYKNTRIIIAAFNPYKNADNKKDHILFTFRNCIGKAAFEFLPYRGDKHYAHKNIQTKSYNLVLTSFLEEIFRLPAVSGYKTYSYI